LSIERNPFPEKNQTLEILQSMYFTYEVGIISSYSNRIKKCLFFLVRDNAVE